MDKFIIFANNYDKVELGNKLSYHTSFYFAIHILFNYQKELYIEYSP